MSAAAAVTIIAAVLIVLALAAYLIAISLVLKDITSKLGVVIGAVGTIAAKTEPVEPVVGSINRNLGAAKDLLNGLLVSKVGAQAAADIIASVDPLGAGGNGGGAPAAAPAPAQRIQYGSGGGSEADAAPPAPAPGRAPAGVGHGTTRLRVGGAAPPADEGVGHGVTRLRTSGDGPAAVPPPAPAPSPAAAPPAPPPAAEEPGSPGRITIRRKGFPGS
jgi:hypothetical protein